MMRAWVVVADACRARIFSAEKPASELKEIQTLSHPESRLHQGDLLSDNSIDLANTNDTKHDEAQRFANHVCETLECGRNNHRFEKLYVVAAPNFMGLLRKRQTLPLQRMVAGEIPKNLAARPPEDIRRSLPQFL